MDRFTMWLEALALVAACVAFTGLALHAAILLTVGVAHLVALLFGV